MKLKAHPALHVVAALGLIALVIVVITLVVARKGTPENPEYVPGDAPTWADSTLRRLTLHQKIAQLVAVRIEREDYSRGQAHLNRLSRQAGSFIATGLGPREATLLGNLSPAPAGVPPLIGWSAPIDEGASDIPLTAVEPERLHAAGDPALAYASGFLLGLEVASVNLTALFLPDPQGTPGARYSAIDSVSAYLIRGIQDAGISAFIVDTPTRQTSAGWAASSIPSLPFLRTSTTPAPGAWPGADGYVWPSQPLSNRILRPLRWNSFGTNQVPGGPRGLSIAEISDSRTNDAGDRVVDAVAGGADLIVVRRDPRPAHAALLQAVQDGQVDSLRIDEAVSRVLRLKEKYVHVRRPPVQSLGTTPEEGRKLLDRALARKTLRVVLQTAGALPFPIQTDTVNVFMAEPDTLSSIDGLLAELDRWSGIVVRRGLETDGTVIPGRHPSVVIDPIIPDPLQWQKRDSLVSRLQRSGRRVACLGQGASMERLSNVNCPATLILFDRSVSSLSAAGQALFGLFAVRTQSGYTNGGDPAHGTMEQHHVRPGSPEEAGMSSRMIMKIDSLIVAGVRGRAYPGAAVSVGRGGVLIQNRGYGTYTYEGGASVTPGSVFDIASLTKVVATTTAAMLLYDRGQLDIDAPVARYLPEFGQNGKDAVTVRQLLNHSSGLSASRTYHRMNLNDRAEVVRALLEERLVYEPGTSTTYSDLGMAVLGLVIEQITGESLDTYTRREIFQPLGMSRTGYRPLGEARSDSLAVPTEVDLGFRNRLIQGEVHDELAYIMGGIAGHAGLFSTSEDLARFAFMLLNGGRAGGRQFIKTETLRLFTQRATRPRASTRALGWDTRSLTGYSSGGHLLGPNSYGHTGFTGTSIWIDPDQQLFIILLTNRIYPTRMNQRLVPIRADLADLVFQAIAGPPEPLLPRPVLSE